MIQFIKKIAMDAGEICLKESTHLSSADLDFKGTRDLVTKVDRKVEEFLVAEIRKSFPHHTIIGEETGTSGDEEEHCWIIDPIDGTTSFFHGQPFYSVSIAYLKEGKLKAGVVYAPALGQLFSAEKGEGAYLNGTIKLKVSETSRMIDAVLGTGFACLRAGREVNNLAYLNDILPQIRDFRRCGSAAIDLAYVAAGKFDGFWEMDLNSYDISAGVLLVQEAGGYVCDMNGGSDYPESGIVATNGHLTDKIIDCLVATSKKMGIKVKNG